MKNQIFYQSRIKCFEINTNQFIRIGNSIGFGLSISFVYFEKKKIMHNVCLLINCSEFISHILLICEYFTLASYTHWVKWNVSFYFNAYIFLIIYLIYSKFTLEDWLFHNNNRNSDGFHELFWIKLISNFLNFAYHSGFQLLKKFSLERLTQRWQILFCFYCIKLHAYKITMYHMWINYDHIDSEWVMTTTLTAIC